MEVEKTTLNTLRVLELAGMTDIPVYAGAKQPLMGEQVIASHIHGNNGLNDMELPLPKRKQEALPAWDAIYEYAKKYQGELVIVAVGPLTKLALAIAYAVQGDKARTYDLLLKMQQQGFGYDLKDNPSFEKVRGTKAWDFIVDSLHNSLQPFGEGRFVGHVQVEILRPRQPAFGAARRAWVISRHSCA